MTQDIIGDKDFGENDKNSRSNNKTKQRQAVNLVAIMAYLLKID